jgi:hypothetical protein
MTDCHSVHQEARSKLAGCRVPIAVTALTMAAQVTTFSDIADLALCEGCIAPIADPGGVEAIGNHLIVPELEQLVNLGDDVSWGPLARLDG